MSVARRHFNFTQAFQSEPDKKEGFLTSPRHCDLVLNTGRSNADRAPVLSPTVTSATSSSKLCWTKTWSPHLHQRLLVYIQSSQGLKVRLCQTKHWLPHQSLLVYLESNLGLRATLSLTKHWSPHQRLLVYIRSTPGLRLKLVRDAKET